MPTAMPAAALDKLLEPIEDATWLDAVADRLSAVLSKVLPTGPVKDAASGTAIGHPVHPMLVAVPIGSWVAATYLDLLGGKKSRPAAQKLIAFGAVAALPTALTGASDWLDTVGAERRIGLVHATANYTALGMYTASWLARRRGNHVRGKALALGASGALGVGGWLGGHLAYAFGVGVDTTAFDSAPEEWTDVAADTDVTATPIKVAAGDMPVLLVRDGGTIVAIADRCTHRGAPLHEGTIADGCVTCPWHSSVFRLADGSVQRGPATRPQPALEVKVADGRVSVRRPAERHGLRANTTGS